VRFFGPVVQRIEEPDHCASVVAVNFMRVKPERLEFFPDRPDFHGIGDGTFGVIASSKENKIADKYIELLKIKTPGKEQSIMHLSGGNQQKAILARWLSLNPRFVIMDEPTRGIDVGAKREIENLIRQMAGQGISILFISSEFEELIRNCDRIEVIREGINMKTLTGTEITEENIIHAIAGSPVGKTT
jgi:ABC-type sugar transport system ATPase subunit